MASTSGHRKLALIIANDNYNSRNNRLSQSNNNADDLRSILENIGFFVTKKCNLNRSETFSEITKFSKNINDGDLVLFYFSGHGCHINGENYLVPIGDNQSVSDLDVVDSGVHVERAIERLAERNTSYVTIIILDCYRPYFLTSASESNSLVESKGLDEIKASNGVFIQYACTNNKTDNNSYGAERNDLFTKHLLENIALENMDIRDIFRRISDNVYRDSRGKQRPLSMNGLRDRFGEVFLNKVLRQWNEINPKEMESFMTEQDKLKNYYDNFPDIDDVANRNRQDIQQAEQLTESILSQKPSGDVNDQYTTCHILNRLLGEGRQQCLFFDSTKGMHLHDASTNLVDLNFKDRPFVLKLNSSDGLGHEKYVTGKQHDLKIIHALDQCVKQKQSHPVIDDIVERLAQVHNTDKKHINVKSFYSGSLSVVYTVEDIASSVFNAIKDLPKKWSAKFDKFKTAKIHPLLYRPSFDISQFDSRGNRNFAQQGQTFPVGPPGRERLYIQPTGWVRYGLNVLGRYSNDTWLHPFGNPKSWYRAYHGTGNASAADFGTSPGNIDKQYAPVDAAANIYKTGFRKARVAVYGSGVYCSPDPTFPEQKYVGTVKLPTKRGTKAFKCMLQVAVNPDGVNTANKDIWVVPVPENIRAYGILIKEDYHHSSTTIDEDEWN